MDRAGPGLDQDAAVERELVDQPRHEPDRTIRRPIVDDDQPEGARLPGQRLKRIAMNRASLKTGSRRSSAIGVACRPPFRGVVSAKAGHPPGDPAPSLPVSSESRGIGVCAA